MGAEVLLYGYGVVCLSMLVFNVLYGLHLRSDGRRMDAKTEIIRRHMWPLTLIPPRHLPALIVSLADKYCTVREVTGHSYPSFLPR